MTDGTINGHLHVWRPYRQWTTDDGRTEIWESCSRCDLWRHSQIEIGLPSKLTLRPFPPSVAS